MLSPERKNRVTGSQAGAILGLSPWKSREDVIQEWLHGSTFTGNAATEYGTFHEEHAVADLELFLGSKVFRNEKFFIHKNHDWLGCTPDGFHGEDYVVEVKCPFGLRDDQEPVFKSLEEQPHYYAQVQLEMICTGRSKAIFYQWNRYNHRIEFIDLDYEWVSDNVPKLKEFIKEVRQRQLELSDDEQLEMAFSNAQAAFNSAKNALDAIKSIMIEKANGSKRKFGSVSVYPQQRQGSVSYAKVVKEMLPELDLAPWTGEPSVTWIVKGGSNKGGDDA